MDKQISQNPRVNRGMNQSVNLADLRTKRDKIRTRNMFNGIPLGKIFVGDVFAFLDSLPESCVDLAIIDPPYNLKWQSGILFQVRAHF